MTQIKTLAILQIRTNMNAVRRLEQVLLEIAEVKRQRRSDSNKACEQAIECKKRLKHKLILEG